MAEAEPTQEDMIELDNDDNDDHEMRRKRRLRWKYSCFNDRLEPSKAMLRIAKDLK